MRARATESPREGRLILGAILCLMWLTTQPAIAAASESLVRNNFGSAGTIDMPTARMAPDGEFSAGAAFFQNTQHYNFGFQILPWLETSFRYSGLTHFDPSYPVYWDRSFAVKARLWDEGAIIPAVSGGINDVVGTGVYSGEYIVASKRMGQLDFSLGVGWGRLGSTALFKNPFTTLSTSFDNRPTLTHPGGTNFNVFLHGPNAGLFGGVIWHTPIDRFSLIAEYSSDRYELETSTGVFKPRNQLNFGADYQVTDYMNVGLEWLYGSSLGGRASIQLDPSKPQYSAKINEPPLPIRARTDDDRQQALLALLRQNKRGAATKRKANADTAKFVDALWQMKFEEVQIEGGTLVLTSNGDTGKRCISAALIAQAFDEKIQSVVVRRTDGSASQCTTVNAASPPYQVLQPIYRGPALAEILNNRAPSKIIDAAGSDIPAALRAIRADARRQKIIIEALDITETSLVAYYTNTHYFSESDALDRLVRILMQDAPSEIEKFHLIAVNRGIPQQEFSILRAPVEREGTQTDSLNLFDGSSSTIAGAPMQNPVLREAERCTYPRFSWDIYPQLRQELFDPDNPFAIDLALAADASVEIRPGLTFSGEVETSLFDNFGLARLSNSTLPHVRSDFLEYFAQGKTGIGLLDAEYRFRVAPTVLATVKAGYLESMFAGGGGEVLWRPEGQRWALGADAYEVWQRGFDRLFDTQSYRTFTGHISLYYASPWHDLNFMVSAGQYLAGDRGLTFQVSRRFSTGVEIGAFFTKTNVSSEQFGEGSFDKGIIIRIPLGWALPIETQGQWNINLRPVQRDGGQRLGNDATLYDENERTNAVR